MPGPASAPTPRCSWVRTRTPGCGVAGLCTAMNCRHAWTVLTSSLQRDQVCQRCNAKGLGGRVIGKARAIIIKQGESAAPRAQQAAQPSCRSSAVCTTFKKVVFNTVEAAKQVLITKAKHRQLGTGLVVRQALTPAEQAMQRRYMPLYRELKKQGVAADFRRGRLYARQHEEWEVLQLP